MFQHDKISKLADLILLIINVVEKIYWLLNIILTKPIKIESHHKFKTFFMGEFIFKMNNHFKREIILLSLYKAWNQAKDSI